MRVVALIEHVDRELDLISLLRLLLKQRHDIDLDVANFYTDAPLTLAGAAPHVALTPFFYATEDLVMRDYVDAWPQTRFVNLAWEQLFYPSHALIKAPRDAFTREKVTHLAWSQAYCDYLQSHGVAPGRARRVGHSLFALYRAPYTAYFADRSTLAEAFELDNDRRWVFVPENYRWAFFSDTKLKKLSRRGVEAQDLVEMRDYCRNALTALIRWCQTLAADGQAEVIFRPRPATSVEELSGFIRGVLGDEPPAFHIIKGRSAREWVLASEVVASSYSTVLIEAAIAGKAILRADPEPIPPSLHYDWCDLAPSVTTEQQFFDACLASDTADSSAPLRGWAEAAFDPAGAVDRLVAAIADEVGRAGGGEVARGAERMVMPDEVAQRARALPPAERHDLFQAEVPGYFFNPGTHEKDLFDADEVSLRVARWRSVLGGS